MLDSPAVNAFALPGGFIYIRIAMRDDTDPAMNLDFWLSSGAAPVWNPARRTPPADWERQIDVPHIRVTTSMRVLNAAPSPLRPHLLWNAENLAALK